MGEFPVRLAIKRSGLMPCDQSAMLDDSKTDAQRSCGSHHRKTKHVDVLRELWKLRYGRLIVPRAPVRRRRRQRPPVILTNQPYHQCIHNPPKASTDPVRGIFDFRLSSTLRHLRQARNHHMAS